MEDDLVLAASAIVDRHVYQLWRAEPRLESAD
jgi:hypothetical protein